MQFEWDPEKARSNLAKHGVSFEDARLVWEDELAQFRLERIVEGEERWHAIMKGVDMKTKLSAEQLERLERLAALPDESIDYSDAPPLTDEQWADPRRPSFYKARKQPVTIRLDADVIDWFKGHSGGKPYQTEINRVLRQHVARAGK